MGNHIVGEMYHVASIAIQDKIPQLTQEEAIAILDRITEAIKSCYHYSSDVEVDDYASPEFPFGKLLIKAQSPENYDRWVNMNWGTATDEECEELGLATWWKFKEKHGFW